jgi:hypothetical protein
MLRAVFIMARAKILVVEVALLPKVTVPSLTTVLIVILKLVGNLEDILDTR